MRIEDDALLRGAARYVDDLEGDWHHVVFVRSPIAHGRITRIDVSNVAASFTADDLALRPIRGHAGLPPEVSRPPLATDTVRFVGEPVVAVVAPTRAMAVDAAEKVVVEYERLPVVLLDDPEAPTVWQTSIGSEHDVLRDADVIVRGQFVNQRVASSPMEPDGAAAIPDPETGGVVVWASTQRVHHVRDAIASSLDLDPELVRVRAPNVGGGFGGKFEPSPETVVAAALALKLGVPIRWIQTRTENLQCMPHGRGQLQRAALGLTSDGTFTGIWVELTADAGAYPTVGALIPGATLAMAPGTYRFERMGGAARSVMTNTAPVGAYRGAGRPEAAAMLERLVDMAAQEVGVDPIELRRRNLVSTDAFPFTSATGMRYDSGDYARCLDGVTTALDLRGVRDEQASRRATGERHLLGVGVAMWIDCTPMNRPGEWASIEISTDGDAVRVLARDGANDQGQAHATTWGLLLAERLGLPIEAIRLEHGDTAFVPKGEGTGSARSLMLAGASIAAAGERVLEQAKEVAASLLEAAPADIVRMANGAFSVAGAPAVSVSWLDVARAGTLAAEADVEQAGPTYPSGCHGAVVEVDVDTGAVRLLRFVAVDDCGRVVNPTVVAGQQHGGIAQGVAQALWEEIVYDDRGTPLTSTLADYAVPSAAELPSLEVSTIETLSPVNGLGAKGIGQAGAIGSTVAVQNAVVNALAHLGVRHVDLPLTPERVWRAMREFTQ
jgi:carbon-monoxide dehydrogenase large subunit